MSLYSKIIDIQKLQAAWRNVKKNKPARGVDDVTWEMFDNNIREELKQLNIELKNHEYHPFPVRMVNMYKEEKIRKIALFSMRDKVVQQATAQELTRIYDADFSENTYAYRPGKSALSAVKIIEDMVESGEYPWVVKLDVQHYFDEIPHKLLEKKLKQKIKEEDSLELIMYSATTPSLQEGGEVKEKTVGIYQGSIVSPILSNIYLNDLDHSFDGREIFYMRYADDILIAAKSKESAMQEWKRTEVYLESLGLSLNQTKSKLVEYPGTFEYLGYAFSPKGKVIPKKAEENLNDRLEMMWLSQTKLTFSEKLKKGAEILEGWEQYFKNKKNIGSIYEYMIILYMTQQKNVDIKYLLSERKKLHNVNPENMKFLIEYWKKKELPDMILYEYEDYYNVAEMDTDVKIEDIYKKELLDEYEEMFQNQQEESLQNIMQIYSDVTCYHKAAVFMKLASEQKNHKRDMVIIQPQTKLDRNPLSLSDEMIHEYMDKFVGREDTYVSESMGENGRRCCEQMAEPLTENVLKRHFKGDDTVGTYVQRNNGTCKFLVIDIDISQKVLLSIRNTPEKMQEYLQAAAAVAVEYRKELKHMGIQAYIEDSGYRGYHVWVFFQDWAQVRYVNLFEDILEQNVKKTDDSVTVEYFPNKTHSKAAAAKQAIKLPYGYHVKTMKQSYFLDEELQPVQDVGKFIRQIALYTPAALKSIIAKYSSAQELNQEAASVNVDENLDGFGEMSENIRIVLQKCNLMRYLCQKARKTGYLTHFERQSLLYVFGHMGEEGADFLHQVMSFTMNYQYQVTQKFLNKIPAKPISCIKLRDQYQKITAECGCNCNFSRVKNCYPSPVLHAIKSGNEESREITLPTSRTITKEKESKVCEELNINKKVQDIAGKILEMKKQKRGIDKEITKQERELERIFNEAGVDCMEVSFGMLVRRKTADGYEWVVEL